MPLRLVSEMSRLLSDLAVVVAATDVDGALALLLEDRGDQSDPPPRPAPAADQDAGGDPADFSAGRLQVFPRAREASVDGVPLRLSAQDFDLLAALASDVERVWSFEDLTARVWRTAYLGDRDHVNSAVKRLRRRLADRPGVEIVSVRGVGYRLNVRSAPAVPAALAEAIRAYEMRPAG
jgi:DNA-binding response OmpR family regulator